MRGYWTYGSGGRGGGGCFKQLFNVSFFSAISISVKYFKGPLGHGLLKKPRIASID